MIMVKKAVMIVSLMSLCLASFAEGLELDLDKEEHLEYALDVSGRRLLRISREAIVRITSCAYAYRLTGQKRYLDKAEEELNAVCAFKDWNESHFLDVGEMALAVSVGYDWLYDALSSATKTAVEKALKEKAFRKLKGNLWSYRQNSRTWSAEPKEVYDEPNKGVTIVGIEADIPAGKSTDFVVTLSR